jgi:hypothetical protein
MASRGSISDLPALGPKSAAMLEQAGVGSVERLRRLGSVAAYVRGLPFALEQHERGGRP